MPRGAVTDWLAIVEDQATSRGVPIDLGLDGRIFHFELGTDPGVIGKVRISNRSERDFRDDRGNEYIWHRYNREQEHAESTDPRPVVNITLDVQTADAYDPDYDHFLVLTEGMVTGETYSKGDQKIRVVGDGVYDGPLADYTNDWDALFAYATEGDATSTASRGANTDERVYRVGEEYRDSRDPDADQFQSWIRGPLDTGIGATAGIRVLKGEAGPYADQITAVVLVSSETADPEGSNPWTDEFLLDQGTIRYWGDAKRETPTEDVDEDAFRGNQQLRTVHRYNQQDRRDQYPPILVFRKPESGVVEFAGLCVIEQLEVEEFRQQGVPTPNYLCHLAVLDVPEVPVRWLHERSLTGDDSAAPAAWQHWVETGSVPPEHRYGSEHSATDTQPWDPVGLEGDTGGRVTTTEQTAVRVSQAFKEQVYETYETGLVTDIEHRGLLSVAHILPRAEYPELAEDLGNVFLLTYTHHRAFDLDLWTIDSEHRLRVAPEFDPDNAWLQNTLTLRDGAQIPELAEAPVNVGHLDQRNQDIPWFPPE